MFTTATIASGRISEQTDLAPGRWVLDLAAPGACTFSAYDAAGARTLIVSMLPGVQVRATATELVVTGQAYLERDSEQGTLTVRETTLTLHTRQDPASEQADAARAFHPSGYTATWQPQQWVRDYAVDSGPALSWPVSLEYLTAARRIVDEHGGYDNDDELLHDPAAPADLREHTGPFTITVDTED